MVSHFDDSVIAIFLTLDRRMLAMFNGQERTILDHIHVTEASGWKIQKIYFLEGNRISHILAEAF